MKAGIVTDGKYGERAHQRIQQKMDAVWIPVPEVPPNVILDDGIELEVPPCDLLLSYVRHPDVILQLAELDIPIILGITPGQGILRQARQINPRVVGPKTMCSLEPNTGIPEVDDFALHFGRPLYSVKCGANKVVEEITVERVSPCGSSEAGAKFILHKPLTIENLQDFALAVCYECRAPRFGHTCDKKLAGTIHVQALLGVEEGAGCCALDPALQGFLGEIGETD